MAPSNSEFRQLPNRREPTDMEKTMRIARKKRAMSRNRLANKQPVPTFVPDSSERINKMQIASLQGLASTYPAASTIDSNPGNDPAFRNVNGELVETWARPEPSPQYQANYFALMTDIDNKSAEAAIVEQNLLQVNQDIIALETKGQPVPRTLRAEAEQLYYKLDKLRKQLDASARELDSKGYTTRSRNTWGGRIGYSSGGFILGAAAFYGLYQFYTRRLSGTRSGPSRSSGNVDPLAAFGRING